MNDGITLQELPDAWEYCGLGEFCDFAGGTQPPKSTFKDKSQDGYIRLLQIRDFESEDYAVFIPKQERLRIVQEEDISIGRYGASVGRILTGKAGAINVAIMTTLPDIRRVDKRFLGYSLQLSEFQQYLRGLGGRAAQAGFNRGEVRRFQFPLPPLCEQRKIAMVLGLVQRAIEQQERLIALTTELKKALLHKLFTEGLRGEPQKQTEIGPVPESWEVVLLKNCAVVQTGVAKGRKLDGREILTLPYLRVANVQSGFLDLREMKTITIQTKEKSRYLLRNGDIVLTEGGDFDKLGRGFIWKGEIDDCVHQNHIFAVRVDRSRLLPEFFAHLSQSPYGKKYFLSVAHKTTNLACINTTKLKGFPILVPTLEEQRDIVGALEAMDALASVHERKRQSLSDLFRTLLQQLMTAQIRMNDIDISLMSGL